MMGIFLQTTKTSLPENKINFLLDYKVRHFIFTRKLTNPYKTNFLFCGYSKINNHRYVGT